MCQADCIWYMHLAKAGYDSAPLTAPAPNYAQANRAFFPAFPGLVAGLAAPTHLPFEICGFIVSNIAFAGFVVPSGILKLRVRINGRFAGELKTPKAPAQASIVLDVPENNPTEMIVELKPHFLEAIHGIGLSQITWFR